MLEPHDEAVRGALTRAIARLGHAPSPQELAADCKITIEEVGRSLTRLQEDHALLLHPGTTRPWVVHPFALAPSACWVATALHGYWASCLYCALGIAAALRADVVITTRLGGESEEVRYRVRGGQLLDPQGVFHLSTPVAKWWDNVIFACSSFQPFHHEGEIDAWCARHALPRGAVMTMPALWSFAQDWYGSYLQPPWRKRTAAEARALFARHRLTGAFWKI
jgi:Alkylmercury lyase